MSKFYDGAPYPDNGVSPDGIHGSSPHLRRAAEYFAQTIEELAEAEDVDVNQIRIWFQKADLVTQHLSRLTIDWHSEEQGLACGAIADHYFQVSLHTINTLWYRGVFEYPHLNYLIPNPVPFGLKAIRWLAIHEFTHLLGWEYTGDEFTNPADWADHLEPFETEFIRLLEKHL